jgi:hypothetical protein
MRFIMRTKYKHSIEKIYGYCRWNHKYPPDDFCLFGIAKWWHSPEMYQYRFCLYGFEIRVQIKRKYVS